MNKSLESIMGSSRFGKWIRGKDRLSATEVFSTEHLRMRMQRRKKPESMRGSWIYRLGIQLDSEELEVEEGIRNKVRLAAIEIFSTENFKDANGK